MPTTDNQGNGEMRKKLAAGNWKMNGTSADLGEVLELAHAFPSPACEVLLCPPATLLDRMSATAKGSAIMTGGQDCAPARAGAHTGDISAEMLLDAGATHVIVGHSERRADHGETDAIVNAKALAAMEAGLVAIVCVGETLAQREAGETLEVLALQLAGSIPEAASGEALVVAYEPIWAIGTGLTPTLAQIGEVHAFIRETLETRFALGTGDTARILYGGSVKPSNAAGIFSVPDVDGALVGGASLKAADFGHIISALSASQSLLG